MVMSGGGRDGTHRTPASSGEEGARRSQHRAVVAESTVPAGRQDVDQDVDRHGKGRVERPAVFFFALIGKPAADEP